MRTRDNNSGQHWTGRGKGGVQVRTVSTSWTGRRRVERPGSEHCGVLSAYGRDTQDDNGEHLSPFASNHDLALVITIIPTPKTGISHTFNWVGNKKRIDNIFKRWRDRKVLRNAFVVHPQLTFLPISDHNIVVVHTKLLDRLIRNHPEADNEPTTPGRSGNNNRCQALSSTPEG